MWRKFWIKYEYGFDDNDEHEHEHEHEHEITDESARGLDSAEIHWGED